MLCGDTFGWVHILTVPYLLREDRSRVRTQEMDLLRPASQLPRVEEVMMTTGNRRCLQYALAFCFCFFVVVCFQFYLPCSICVLLHSIVFLFYFPLHLSFYFAVKDCCVEVRTTQQLFKCMTFNAQAKLHVQHFQAFVKFPSSWTSNGSVCNFVVTMFLVTFNLHKCRKKMHQTKLMGKYLYLLV